MNFGWGSRLCRGLSIGSSRRDKGRQFLLERFGVGRDVGALQGRSDGRRFVEHQQKHANEDDKNSEAYVTAELGWSGFRGCGSRSWHAKIVGELIRDCIDEVEDPGLKPHTLGQLPVGLKPHDPHRTDQNKYRGLTSPAKLLRRCAT
jgi:hypothetical protein